MSNNSPPTLIFIPGAWHKPTCYDKIINILRDKHRLKCIAITLPSNMDNPAATFKDDLDAARDAIRDETTTHGNNVVVIAHSYGGMVGNSAVKGFTRPLDAGSETSSGSDVTAQSSSAAGSTTNKGYVIGLILIASGFTFTGWAFMDPFLGRPPPIWRVNKETGYAELVASPPEAFYHDLPADEADYWSSQLTNFSLKAVFEGGEHSYAGWMDVPVWYVGTVEDRGLPVAVQRIQVGAAREVGARVEHREMQTSHSPFLSRPEETVRVVMEAVDAFTGATSSSTAVQGESLNTGPREERVIILPEARLWQPLTWFKYGLPLVFGHVLGRCFLVFNWTRKLWRPRSA